MVYLVMGELKYDSFMSQFLDRLDMLMHVAYILGVDCSIPNKKFNVIACIPCLATPQEHPLHLKTWNVPDHPLHPQMMACHFWSSTDEQLNRLWQLYKLGWNRPLSKRARKMSHGLIYCQPDPPDHGAGLWQIPTQQWVKGMLKY